MNTWDLIPIVFYAILAVGWMYSTILTARAAKQNPEVDLGYYARHRKDLPEE